MGEIVFAVAPMGFIICASWAILATYPMSLARFPATYARSGHRPPDTSPDVSKNPFDKQPDPMTSFTFCGESPDFAAKTVASEYRDA